MKINTAVKREPVLTHEGAPAFRIGAEQSLKRSVMACMLWEDEFYEDGQSIADRIKSLVPQVIPAFAADIAIEAREKMKLRHVPLLIVREMARHPNHKVLVSNLLSQVIQRPDELTEFLAIYWMDGKQPLSAQVKKGLAAAFGKFSEYQLAKYNRDGAVKLRDVLFLSHAKAGNEDRDALYKRLIDGKLQTPDTWEVNLSAGADKRETFERLMRENKLGVLAFLRNLRNMKESGVPELNVMEYAARVNIERALPFRFISAARAVPQWEPMIETMMLKCLIARPRWPGKTAILVDTSGSMEMKVSGKSEISRADAALGIAILLREVCEEVTVISFATHYQVVAPRRGFALGDAIKAADNGWGTNIGTAVKEADRIGYDRIIVITDEQAHDRVDQPNGKGYMINTASARNGVGYGKWNHIDGWSEAVVDYIEMLEDISQ